MTRNLPDPEGKARSENQRWLYAAVDEILRRIDLHRSTGNHQIKFATNEGGVRAVEIDTGENFKKP